MPDDLGVDALMQAMMDEARARALAEQYILRLPTADQRLTAFRELGGRPDFHGLTVECVQAGFRKTEWNYLWRLHGNLIRRHDLVPGIIRELEAARYGQSEQTKNDTGDL